MYYYDIFITKQKQLEYILKFVAKTTKLKISEIQSKKRNTELVLARHYYAYLATEYTNYSQGKIAKLIKRDRTTLIHYLRNKELKPWILREYEKTFSTITQGGQF